MRRRVLQLKTTSSAWGPTCRTGASRPISEDEYAETLLASEKIVNNEGPVHALAISGSLRRASSNSALVGAAVRLAPATVGMSIYRGLAELPAFNPDLESEGVPEAVTAF